MPDEPSGYELHRALQDLRGDVRTGNAQLNQRLDRLVSVEAHASDMRRVDERLAELAQDIAEERQSRKAADEKLEESQQRMITTQRWVVAAVLIPTAAAVVAIISFVVNLRGGA